MAKGLSLAEPPRRRREEPEAQPSPTLFAKTREGDKVQFNKRIEKSVADGYALLAIRTGKKVPDLLREGLEALEERYGRA